MRQIMSARVSNFEDAQEPTPEMLMGERSLIPESSQIESPLGGRRRAQGKSVMSALFAEIHQKVDRVKSLSDEP